MSQTVRCRYPRILNQHHNVLAKVYMPSNPGQKEKEATTDPEVDIASKKAKRGQDGVTTEFDEIVSLLRSGQPGLYHLRRPDKEAGTHPGLFTPTKQHILEPSGEIRKLDKDIVTIKLAFANNAIQSYKERSTAGQTSLVIPGPGRNTYATAVWRPTCPFSLPTTRKEPNQQITPNLVEVDLNRKVRRYFICHGNTATFRQTEEPRRHDVTNLRHSKTAAATLAPLICENALDVILVQEPRFERQKPPVEQPDLTFTEGKDLGGEWFELYLPSFSDNPDFYFEVLRSVKHPSVIKSASGPSDPDISRLYLSLCKLKIDAGQKKHRYLHKRCLGGPRCCNLYFSKRILKAFKLLALQKAVTSRMAYAQLKVTYQRALRRAKRATRDNLRSSKPDGKELFDALKVLSGKSACVSFPQTLSVDGYEASDPKNCAKHFSWQIHLRTRPITSANWDGMGTHGQCRFTECGVGQGV
ncbi:hypothetical protein DAPPUDRAFT_108333 [Daphnia pulex]|uniref:Endonuclease/exonuclease/phosphatase domain-containing protein n=1 Tax=Daphnia pulex TaxID=6669 RepID=E9GZV2_DAPPU|nr:hypothetical protein DAPPUDRAFT_108333 [Daphnia pulex]|eukprot:EFX74878.1 hypothetical protein DAPPUDRAFT_108333 [Daphnia pulex]